VAAGRGVPGKAEAERQLRELVESEIGRRNAEAREAAGKVVRKGPYYFKSYVTYPEGSKSYKMEVIETDSVLKPFKARVVIPQRVYSTDYHLSRAAAQNDTSLYVDYGEVDIIYEYVQGRWEKRYSVFISHGREVEPGAEENIPRRAVPQLRTEERRGLWGRVLDLFSF